MLGDPYYFISNLTKKFRVEKDGVIPSYIPTVAFGDHTGDRGNSTELYKPDLYDVKVRSN